MNLLREPHRIPAAPLIVFACTCLCVRMSPPADAQPAAAEPHFDFETGDLQGWTVVEGKFDLLVCDRADFHNTGEPYNKQGAHFLSTLERSDYKPDDKMMGEVRSPTFVLRSSSVCFLVGGGKGPGVYVALCLADTDEEVRAARGDNTETMRRHLWDTRQFAGHEVYLKIVDQETGGWGHITFDDFRGPTAEELAAIPPDNKRPPASPYAMTAQAACEARLQSVRLAIVDLLDTFGARYPKADEYLDRVAALQGELQQTGRPGGRRKLKETAADVDAVSREALLANPLLSRQPILYVSRDQYRRDHHNTETMFQNGASHTNAFRGGTSLKLVDLATGAETVVFDAPEGGIRDPEVHFDGERVIFSYRENQADDYHIWEIGADGSGLRQLTDGWGVSDIDPMYLPNGPVVFTSTRDSKACACNVHAQGNLFAMDADGSNIRQLSRNTLFDGHPCLMLDGRVLYYRWEYVDKHFGPAQGLWTVNPDGTEHAVYYGNNAWWPGAIFDGRPIPGTDRVIATLGSCHAPPFGEIGVIDRRLGFDGETPLVKTWPQVPVNRDGYDHVWKLPLRYEDPYPLSDKHFLCSRTIDRARSDCRDLIDKYGIFLIDIFGNEVLIHADSEKSCFDPMPLSPRLRPPSIPPKTEGAPDQHGTFYVCDVYRGTGMESVKRGAVKWLRVVESPPKRFISTGDYNNGARQAPVMNWSDVVNKRIIGTVPVEEDGSAHFTAPADTFLFFQLLDSDGMMIQSMRSGTILQPGEVAGCIGCHEERNTVVPAEYSPRALARAPSRPEPWYGPPREFNYATEVQPVLDRYCLSCHDYGKQAESSLILSGDKTLLFSLSYLELHRRSGTQFKLTEPGTPDPLIKVVNHGPPEVLPAYSWGSHRSSIVQVLRDGHYGVELDSESFDRLVTWIDLNAVYYGSFACTRPGHLGGRCPIPPADIKRLNELAALNVTEEVKASHVNLTRPELSLCLLANLSPEAGGTAEPGKARFASRDDPAYQEALAIIRAGADSLRDHPRMDMPGAVPAANIAAVKGYGEGTGHR